MRKINPVPLDTWVLDWMLLRDCELQSCNEYIDALTAGDLQRARAAAKMMSLAAKRIDAIKHQIAHRAA